jgi:DNA polymerase III subunit chi
MPIIKFYILNKDTKQDACLFACHLIEKNYLTNNPSLYLHHDNLEEAESMDKLLWAYTEDSFIPHHLSHEKDITSAITIGYDNDHLPNADICINLSCQYPANCQQFKEIIEIVYRNPPLQQLARERYRAYRDAGYSIETIK